MEFQLSYFKSYKTMLWKYRTQYASKFGKLSNGHRTGKVQFSFQSQRKAMPKNIQTTAQLHSSHTLALTLIKRRLLLGRKVMTNLDSIFKSRDITLPTRVHLVKAMVFPVVMYGCELEYKENWSLKTWCFWTVVLEKTLESPLDSKEIQPVHPKGDQSWVFTGRTDAKKLKLKYFGHLMQRVDSLEKTPMLGGIGGRRRRGW